MRLLKLIHIVFGVILSVMGMFSSCNDSNAVAEILTEMESKPLKLCMANMLCLISGQDTIGYLPQDYKYLMIVNVGFHPTFSRHGIAQTSLALLV